MNITLKALREQAGLSVKEVAQILGVSNRTAYSYEQGTRRMQFEHALLLAKLYDCELDEVVEAQLNSIQIRQSQQVICADIKKLTY